MLMSHCGSLVAYAYAYVASEDQALMSTEHKPRDQDFQPRWFVDDYNKKAYDPLCM